MISKSNIDTRTPFPSVHLFMLVNGPSLRDEYENMQNCAPKITRECSFWNRVDALIEIDESKKARWGKKRR